MYYLNQIDFNVCFLNKMASEFNSNSHSSRQQFFGLFLPYLKEAQYPEFCSSLN